MGVQVSARVGAALKAATKMPTANIFCICGLPEISGSL
jgi:hypothetical protein